MTMADEVAQARQAKFARNWNINPLMAEIVDALLELSCAAHRDAVVATVALRRGKGAASEGLRREIYQIAEVHCEKADETGHPPLLHLPFGAGSYRWALTPEVIDFMREHRPLPAASPAPAARGARRPVK